MASSATPTATSSTPRSSGSRAAATSRVFGGIGFGSVDIDLEGTTTDLSDDALTFNVGVSYLFQIGEKFYIRPDVRLRDFNGDVYDSTRHRGVRRFRLELLSRHRRCVRGADGASAPTLRSGSALCVKCSCARASKLNEEAGEATRWPCVLCARHEHAWTSKSYERDDLHALSRFGGPLSRRISAVSARPIRAMLAVVTFRCLRTPHSRCERSRFSLAARSGRLCSSRQRWPPSGLDAEPPQQVPASRHTDVSAAPSLRRRRPSRIWRASSRSSASSSKRRESAWPSSRNVSRRRARWRSRPRTRSRRSSNSRSTPRSRRRSKRGWPKSNRRCSAFPRWPSRTSRASSPARSRSRAATRRCASAAGCA